MEIETPRLRLRQWRDEDVAPFFAMGRDPEVMAHFPELAADEAEARGQMERVRAYIADKGFGFWAVEVRGGPAFVGFCGIQEVRFAAPFTPAVEVGWRLARGAWGNGYATEGARAALAHGFGTLGLAEIVAFLLPANRRSAAVCERLGMTRDERDDFDHPNVAEGKLSVGGLPQRRHALYRLRRDRFGA